MKTENIIVFWLFFFFIELSETVKKSYAPSS